MYFTVKSAIILRQTNTYYKQFYADLIANLIYILHTTGSNNCLLTISLNYVSCKSLSNITEQNVSEKDDSCFAI